MDNEIAWGFSEVIKINSFCIFFIQHTLFKKRTNASQVKPYLPTIKLINVLSWIVAIMYIFFNPSTFNKMGGGGGGIYCNNLNTGANPGGGGGRTRRPLPLKLKKIWFFGVKSWFFTRNTPKIFAPSSARRNLFKCPPPQLEILDPPLKCIVITNSIFEWCTDHELYGGKKKKTTKVMSSNPAHGEVYSIQL